MPAALPEVAARVPQVIQVARQLQRVRDVRRAASFKRGGQVVELCFGHVQRGQPLVVRVAQPGHLRPDPATPRQVPAAEPLTLAVQVQLRGGELAQRFEHAVPQTGSGLGSDQQRLVDQCGEQRGYVQCRLTAYLGGSGCGPPAGEDRQPAEQHGGRRVEQRDTPPDGPGKGPMPVRDASLRRLPQREPAPGTRQHLRQPVAAYLGGRQLQGKRQPVEGQANLHYGARIARIHGEIRLCGAHPGGEQRHAGNGGQLGWPRQCPQVGHG